MIDRIMQSVRENYDRIADLYASHLFEELAKKPFDRELLQRFAADVRPSGEVCDIGCGPGQIARYLRDTGTTVFGVDISPRMIERARQLNPDISFREGDMMALDMPDATLAGMTAFYAIVNTPRESLPLVFQEMRRVLEPGGLLLLAFHIGDETLHPNELWGQSISMDFFLFQPLAIQHCLKKAGFVIEGFFQRDPYPPEVEYQSQRAYIFARKPLTAMNRTSRLDSFRLSHVSRGLRNDAAAIAVLSPHTLATFASAQALGRDADRLRRLQGIPWLIGDNQNSHKKE
jgi:ubiquinone/menaquinone biosynthesis C-methylase UbiE